MKSILKSALVLLLWEAVPLRAGTTVTNVAAGYYHSLFLKSDGSLWGTGGNFEGQLGDGTFNNTNRLEQIVSSGVTAIAGGLYHTLFMKTDGSLWGMGLDNYGQLGDGMSGYNYHTNRPEQINRLFPAVLSPPLPDSSTVCF
ncbi:MAG: hypothetical protein KGJ60_03185 [Verrucomicrobiota bacterium]|nr:hypothetical protein [Verrucomicrobiota bacterium]